MSDYSCPHCKRKFLTLGGKKSHLHSRSLFGECPNDSTYARHQRKKKRKVSTMLEPCELQFIREDWT